MRVNRSDDIVPKVPAECTYTSTSPEERAIHLSASVWTKGQTGRWINPIQNVVCSVVVTLIFIIGLRFPDCFRGNEGLILDRQGSGFQ